MKAARRPGQATMLLALRRDREALKKRLDAAQDKAAARALRARIRALHAEIARVEGGGL